MTYEQTNWNYNTGANVAGLGFDEMLEAADLNWEVETSPHNFGHFSENTAPNLYDVWRADTKEFIDCYSNRKPQKNSDIVKFFGKLLNLADLQIETLGHINSRTIYASARLPQQDMDVRKVGDNVQTRIVLTDSHANNEGFRVYTHFHRLVCTNGMTRKVSVKAGVINHTSQVNREKARKLLNAAIVVTKEENQISEFLAEKEMSIEAAQLQLIAAFGNPDKSIDEQSATVKTCLELFAGNAQGSDLLSAYQTAYGLLQSVTEYYSHHSTTQSAATRFNSLLNGNYAKASSQFQTQLVRAYR